MPFDMIPSTSMLLTTAQTKHAAGATQSELRRWLTTRTTRDIRNAILTNLYGSVYAA